MTRRPGAGRLLCTPYYPVFLLFFMPWPVASSAFTRPPLPTGAGAAAFLASIALLLAIKFAVHRANLRRPAALGPDLGRFLGANFVSTFYGILLASVLMSPLFLVIFLPLMAAILRPVARRAASGFARPAEMEWILTAILVLVSFVGVGSLYGVMQVNVWMWNSPDRLALYWAAKVLFYILGAGILLLYSAWIELSSMRNVAGGDGDPWDRWGDAVLRSNAAVFILYLAVAAAIALPARLGSPTGLIPFPSGAFFH